MPHRQRRTRLDDAIAELRVLNALDRTVDELERPPAADRMDTLVDELERSPAWHPDCGSPVCPGPHLDPPGWPPLPRLRP